MIPGSRANSICPLYLATSDSIPVPIIGASGLISGTAWRCIFEPINALLASSCSRNGISDVVTLNICFGDTSIKSIKSGASFRYWPPRITSILSSTNSFRSFKMAFAWAIPNCSSLSAVRYSISSETKGTTFAIFLLVELNLSAFSTVTFSLAARMTLPLLSTISSSIILPIRRLSFCFNSCITLR